MKPLVSNILRGAGGLLFGLVEAIARKREGKRQATAREVLDASPSSIPAAQARAQEALRRRLEEERRNRETGLPEVDEAVREAFRAAREGER